MWNFFTYKIAPIWNRLPAEAVNSASVEQFKIELDNFYFLGYTEYRESIALVRKIEFEILMKIHFLRHADLKRITFGMSSVCLSVDTITLKIIELAQPNLVCDLI